MRAPQFSSQNFAVSRAWPSVEVKIIGTYVISSSQMKDQVWPGTSSQRQDRPRGSVSLHRSITRHARRGESSGLASGDPQGSPGAQPDRRRNKAGRLEASHKARLGRTRSTSKIGETWSDPYGTAPACGEKTSTSADHQAGAVVVAAH